MIHVTTDAGNWSRFVGQITAFLQADTVDFDIEGQRVHGYRSPDSPALWIRDHSDMLRGARYIDADMTSAVDLFAAYQRTDGRVYDFVLNKPQPGTRENWETWVRVPVEADVEYRFVKAGYLAWQATGDLDWLKRRLPDLDRALRYTATHPMRWDAKHGLVKRPYTIDTWDFDYTAGRYPGLNFQITDDTFWGLFHGDNSGAYESAYLLAGLYDAVGEPEKSAEWRTWADGLQARANALLFNGAFYTHFHKLTPVTFPGVDEAAQLTLSTPMALNRGLATPEIAEAVLDEYARRHAEGRAFAPWFSVDPPFPSGSFGDEKLVAGAYINGGIFPLAGGELARAALVNGRERFGVEALETYRDLILSTGETYLWYFPDGTPSSVETSTSPEAMPTDGWGASAMLWAFVEGLCGIIDEGAGFERVQLAPCWPSAGVREAAVDLSYAASGAGFGYTYTASDARTTLVLKGDADVQAQIQLPEGAGPATVSVNGEPVPATKEQGYVQFDAHVAGETTVEVQHGA